MEIAKVLIILIALTSCSQNKLETQIAVFENDDYSSIIEDKGAWVDIREIKQSNGFFLSNSGKIYGVNIASNDSFSIEEYLESLSPIPYADVKTLKVCINNDNEPYAKDNNRVYYASINGVLSEDGYNMSAEIFSGDISIKDADPATFKYIGQGYGIDKNNIYFEGYSVPYTDIPSFKVIGKGYAVDKHNMYYMGKKIKWNNHIIEALQQDNCPDFLPTDYGLPRDK